MADISVLATPGPYHIIAYGTLLGSSIFQTFFVGPAAYTTLTRSQFSSLQHVLFPLYFSLQSALPVVLALTYPGTNSTFGASPGGLSGFLAKKNRYSVLAPIVAILACSLLNLLIFGPTASRLLKERKHQETLDGKKRYDGPPHSKEMSRLNRMFHTMHAASNLMNIVLLLVTMWYGVELAARI